MNSKKHLFFIQIIIKKQKVLLIGGTGYFGSKIRELLDKDYEVFTFSRTKLKKRNHIAGSILNQADLDKAIISKDFVVNLIGLSPIKRNSAEAYQKIHVDGIKSVIKSCKKAGVKKLVHVSALGADKSSKSNYLRTKAEAEELIVNSKLNYTILRPSFLYGAENEFVKTMKLLAKFKLVPFPNIKYKLQPINVEDAAQTVKMALESEEPNQILSVVGKEKLTFYELGKRAVNEYGGETVPLPAKPFLWILKIAQKLRIVSIDLIVNLKRDNTAQ